MKGGRMRTTWRTHWRAWSCAALIALSCPLAPAAAGDLDFDGTPWAAAARPHGLDPALLYALTLIESRRGLGANRIGPWPWVIRTPTGSYWFNSRARAERGLRAVLAKWPAKAVDVGAAQVNVGWHRKRFGDPAELLALDHNLRIAAAILADAIRSTSDTVLGVGRYHHWSSEPRARAYGQRVWWAYRTIIFGERNPAARYLVATEAGFIPLAARFARD